MGQASIVQSAINIQQITSILRIQTFIVPAHIVIERLCYNRNLTISRCINIGKVEEPILSQRQVFGKTNPGRFYDIRPIQLIAWSCIQPHFMKRHVILQRIALDILCGRIIWHGIFLLITGYRLKATPNMPAVRITLCCLKKRYKIIWFKIVIAVTKRDIFPDGRVNSCISCG